MPVTRVSGLPLPAPASTSSPFITSVDPTKRFFLDQVGNPIFAVGDSAWDLAVNLSTTDMSTYFSTRKSQGFNTAIVLLFADTYVSATNGVTFDGIAAFTGTVGGSPDFTTPNSAYWARMDTMVSLAQQNNITLMLVPGDFTTSGGGSYCMIAARANGHANCVSYGNFLGNRYKNSPNVIWMHGNDYGAGADDTYVAGVMQGIQAVWPSSLHTVEFTSGGDSYSLQAGGVWPTSIQSDQVYPNVWYDITTLIATAYGSSPTMPAFLGEDNYENLAGVTNFQLRRQAHWPMLAGGIGGYYYGNQNVYPFGGGWQAALTSTAVTELGYWASLYRGLHWWTLVPDTTNVFLTGGLSSAQTLSLGAVTPDGSLGVVYAPSANPVVAMSKMRGSAAARWYDPTLGTFSSIGTFPNTGSQTFTLPAAHADGNKDYVLVLTA